MPRASAEAKSASVWRGGGKHPEPPTNMSREEKQLWREIVGCRPADFFQAGSLTLLMQFCAAAVTQDHIRQKLAKDRDDDGLIRKMKDLAAIINSTAIKLRISVQADIHPNAAKRDEKEPQISSFIGGIATHPDISELN